MHEECCKFSASSRGPVRLSSDFQPVTDADEEVFILYSERQTNRGSEPNDNLRGLGYVDSHKDILNINFEIKGLTVPALTTNHKKRYKHHKEIKVVDKTIEFELYQDKTALHSRKGDTGSVLWRASIDFAQLILQQYYSNSEETLLKNAALSSVHVVELGAGTGLLGIALSSLVQQYTVTDIGLLIPLIQKNVNLNKAMTSNVRVEELDWITLESASSSEKTRVYDVNDQPIDLLLAVDCLYHPILIPPFVETLDYLSTPGRTAVLIVSELRSEDVIREFLEKWLSKPSWEIWRIPNEAIGRHYAIWLGWKLL